MLAEQEELETVAPRLVDVATAGNSAGHASGIDCLDLWVVVVVAEQVVGVAAEWELALQVATVARREVESASCNVGSLGPLAELAPVGVEGEIA